MIIPLEVILDWPQPNYINPDSRGPALWVVSSIFFTAATFTVVVRLWTRVFIRKWFGPDDLLIVLAYLCTVGVNVCVGIGVARFGWDHHMWDMPVSHIEPSTEVLYFSRIFWGLASVFVRLSVLCLYYRLVRACEAPRHFFWILHAMAVWTVGMLFFFFFTGIIPCLPIRAYWVYPQMANAKCIDDGLAWKIAAVLNTSSEFCLATLPLIGVYRLGVDRRQRWSVISLLSLGFFVALAGCLRTFYIWKVLETYDLTWWGVPQWICSELEIDLALICACAAPVRPLVTRLLRRFRGVQSSIKFPSFPKSQSSGTSYNTRPSKFGGFGDASAEWMAEMSRAIDLDGIANDGMGYTVTITGPARKRSKLKKWSQPGVSSVQQRKASVSKCANNGKTGLEIPMETEVMVRESYLEAQQKRSRWGSLVSDAENMKFENVEFGKGEDGMGYLGDSSFLKSASEEREVTGMKNWDGFDRLSIDSVEALPAMPSKATYTHRSRRPSRGS